MNILQIVHRFLPTAMGGSEIYAYQLCKELQKRNTVSVLHTSRDLTQKQYTVHKGNFNGLPVTEIINNNWYNSFEETYNNPVVDEIFSSIVEQRRPDVIHIHHLEFLSANIISLAKERGIPVIVTLHDFWLMCPREIRMKPDLTRCDEVRDEVCGRCISDPAKPLSDRSRPSLNVLYSLAKYTTPRLIDILKTIKAAIPETLIRRAARSEPAHPGDQQKAIRTRNAFIKRTCAGVDLFVSPSRFLKNEYISFGLPAERILYSPHGHVAEGVRTEKRKSPALRFGFVGILAEHKGVHILIEAFNRVQERDVVLNIYGYNDFNLRYVKRLKAMNRNAATRFHGKFDRDSLAEVYSNIDVLVMTATCFENAPMTISEALMARTPVITSDLGGMAELILHGENGLLFKVGDPEDLYVKMKMVINDRSLVETLAEGIKLVKTIEKDTSDFEQRYLSLRKQI